MITEAFVDFCNSYLNNYNLWVNTFKGKLLLEEKNPNHVKFMIDIKYAVTKKEMIMRAIEYYYHDQTTIDQLKDFLSDDDDVYNYFMLKDKKGAWYTNKIYTMLKKVETIRISILSKWNFVLPLFFKGSIDGLEILSGLQFENINGELTDDGIKLAYDAIEKLEKEIFIFDEHLWMILTTNKLLFEDLLCEFHILWRLFENSNYEFEKFIYIMSIYPFDLTEPFVEIEMSQYIDSNLPYSMFQKQIITSIKMKNEK